jgi:hypothetical protein
MTIWNIFRPFGILYGNLVYLACGHGIFFPFWYVWTDKNLATLNGDFLISILRGHDFKY